MKTFIISNYQWIFSGIGVMIIAVILKILKPRKEKNTKKTENIINVINNLQKDFKTEKIIPENENTDTVCNKKDIRFSRNILFIDDDIKFKIVSILKKAGWKNVEIKKDVASLQAPEIIAADIIFVDIQGVGLKLGFKDQGLGLV
jgi:hypothetical protein